eukprot:15341668-Ditylum_brightwellii.AAC.1
MKIRGVLVDILINLCPGVYEEHVVTEKGKKVLYVKMLNASVPGQILRLALYFWQQEYKTQMKVTGPSY